MLGKWSSWLDFQRMKCWKLFLALLKGNTIAKLVLLNIATYSGTF